jgi:hypothetical protein
MAEAISMVEPEGAERPHLKFGWETKDSYGALVSELCVEPGRPAPTLDDAAVNVRRREILIQWAA